MSRILVIGENPRLDTGQGRVGRTVANALQKAGHGVLYVAWCQSEINRQRHLDYKILFVDDYGGKAFDNIVIAERPDVVLTVGDAWNFDYINLSTVRGLFQWIAYTAVDGLGYAGGIPRHHEAYLAQADYVVAYTEFGRRAIIRTMPYVVNKIDVIYHGVDDTVFKPIATEDRKKLRQQLNIDGKFVCLYAGRTHFRKNVAYIMKAFNALKRAGKTDKCVLWMHTSFEDPQNYNVHRMIKEFDLDGMIYTFDQVKNMKSPIQHIEEKDYNLLLNAADCLINMGGEGMGYTVLEAFFTKTAVITLGDSATGETGGKGRAILVKPSSYMTGIEITERPLVDPKELAAKILDCKGRNNTEMVNTAYEWAQENIAQRVIDKRWQRFMDRYEHPLNYDLILEAV